MGWRLHGSRRFAESRTAGLSLENELVSLLRAQIEALGERNADLEEGRDNHESQYALMEKQLARKGAKLEAEEEEAADL